MDLKRDVFIFSLVSFFKFSYCKPQERGRWLQDRGRDAYIILSTNY
jgi:hypothetical protein